MLTGTELTSDERVENKGRRINGRMSAQLWAAAGLAGIVFVGAWLKYSPGASGSSAGAPPGALPQVVVSKPLVQDIDIGTQDLIGPFFLKRATVLQTVIHDHTALSCSWANVTAATWLESRLSVEMISRRRRINAENLGATRVQ